MKKQRLVVEIEYEFSLLGISSSVKPYKLAWSINQHLNLNLVRQSDYELEEKNGVVGFTNFVHQIEDQDLTLFKNKAEESSGLYLVPEHLHFDFIIKYMHGFQTFAPEELIKALKEVECIEYIAPIDLKNLKSKMNFLE